MITKKNESNYIENGLELLTRQYDSLTSKYTYETICFRLISFTWLLTSLIWETTMQINQLASTLIIAVTIATIWKATTIRIENSRKRLEKALIEFIIKSDDGQFENIYVHWMYEKEPSRLRAFSSLESYVWFVLTAVGLVIKFI